MLPRRRLRVGLSILVVTLAVTGCRATPPAPADPPASPPAAGVGAPTGSVFAYLRPAGLRVVRDGVTVAEVPLGPGGTVRDAEWTVDGARFVVATGTRLISIDTAAGSSVEAACVCDSIAVAAGKVYALNPFGPDPTRLAGYDAATLAPAGTLRPNTRGTGLRRIDGAGDRLVAFPVTATGARDVMDVVVVDPGSGSVTKVGSTDAVGQPVEAAFTPHGWRGRPVFAYVASGSAGADDTTASVVWLDPTGTAPQVVTGDPELRPKTPGVAAAGWSSGRADLWWAADGTLGVAAWTWSCAPRPGADPADCDRRPRTQWRFDGTGWTMTDERDLATVRHLGGDSTIELTRGPDRSPGLDGGPGQDGGSGQTLTLVRGRQRSPLATDVRRVWTPPGGRSAPPGVPDVVARYAPMIWLAEDEDSRPGSAEEFLASAKLVWSNDLCKDDVLAEPGEVDVARLTTRYGYTHHATKVDPYRLPGGLRCTDTSAVWDTVQPTRPYDGAPDGPPGRQGFLLDADNAVHRGKPLDKGASTAPVYFQYREREYIYYWFFYPFNDAPGRGLDHEGDWERVSVRLDPATNEPVALVYSGHGHACHRPWADVSKTGDGRPRIYSADGTHASYATPGRQLLKHVKVHGVQLPAYDQTGEGARWETWRHLAEVQRQPWWGYAGGWGEAGPYRHETGPVGPYPGRNLGEVHTGTRCE